MIPSPFFTIITASLNREISIQRTLASIKNQTFKDLEHIVIDGGSTDGTLEIIRAFEGTYNLSYISEPDSGIAKALNKGLNKAKGKYVLIIQADDCLIDATILERVYPLLENERCDIYSFPIVKNCLDSENVLLNPIRVKWWNRFKFIFLHQGAFVHKRVYERVGNFRTEFSIAMDYDFFYRALKEKPVIAFGNFPVAEMSGDGIGSNSKFLSKRLKEEALVQTANETNIFWKFVQTIFRFLYVPYKTRLLPILKKGKR
jgi:glycosyltransferase involved in cell wall biosynthesis